MRDVFVQKIAETFFFNFRAKINCRVVFYANMTWFGVGITISRKKFLSEYAMTAGRGANKQEKCFKRIRLPLDPKT